MRTESPWTEPMHLQDFLLLAANIQEEAQHVAVRIEANPSTINWLQRGSAPEPIMPQQSALDGLPVYENVGVPIGKLLPFNAQGEPLDEITLFQPHDWKQDLKQEVLTDEDS